MHSENYETVEHNESVVSNCPDCPKPDSNNPFYLSENGYMYVVNNGEWVQGQYFGDGFVGGSGSLEMIGGIGRIGQTITLTKGQWKSINSYFKQISSHKNKLAEYIKNPLKFDNKGFLKNAPNKEVMNKIIKTRVNHLKQEIKTFRKNIDKIINKNTL